MGAEPPKLVTVGVIASELGITVDRVTPILRRHPHIKPRAFAGNVRLFDNAAIVQVRHKLETTEAQHAGGER
ncbi:MAG: hypothetical protein JSU63_07535 [Phycisphaerales bacterium]|nr:MAG: hypothetical protein JSU63_07535 [Phycisphaerales bacterium]